MISRKRQKKLEKSPINVPTLLIKKSPVAQTGKYDTALCSKMWHLGHYMPYWKRAFSWHYTALSWHYTKKQGMEWALRLYYLHNAGHLAPCQKHREGHYTSFF